MAKAAGPLFSERATGSIGGCLTFDTHRGTPVVRRRSHTAQPRTAAQLAARSRFAALQRTWAQLTPAERALWQTWAEAFEPNEKGWYEHVRWDGMHAHLALNSLLLLVGETPKTSPPELRDPAPVANVTAVYQAAPIKRIYFTWNPYLDFNMYALIFSATHLQPHTHPDKSEYRFIKYIPVQFLTKEWVDPPRGQLHFLIPVLDKRNGLTCRPAYVSCWSDG